MIQQVNLYQDILRQEQNKSGINPYWLGLSGIALLFIGFSAHTIWNLKNMETQVRQSHQNLEAELARVNLLSAHIPKQEVDTQLSAEVAQWQTMLDEITQTMQLLTDKHADQSPGFSSYFQGLANQSIPEVWLSSLYLDGQKQIINIEGSTFNPEKIPFFLQQLQKEPIFNGHTFAKLSMQKSESVEGQMDFKLSTSWEAPNKKDHAQ
ncbi:PilN domain-containing protein [Methylobacter sp. Wu8]|jgi:hypothetical protein|uniref:Fimbrial assembly protein PilN n=1 Tax=Methylobacter tundripaludum TaxID=173365 RepID=A0A2S6H5R1_9GAMM|nr:PilN domain-containing protein [Methylobacter tundripaludum]MCF7965153.1 PilN domain-containing protein [Methylobacter tundripaludum]PPK72760.1 fimbrial assembly protein PilN [Methylobacter tundripaludum]